MSGLRKKYFSLVRCVFAMQGEFTDLKLFRSVLLEQVGWCTVYTDIFTGVRIPEAKSISRAECSDRELQEIYNRTITHCMMMYCKTDKQFEKVRMYER